MSGRHSAGRPASRISFEYRLDVLPEHLAGAMYSSHILLAESSSVVRAGGTEEVPGNGSELGSDAPQSKDLSLREGAQGSSVGPRMRSSVTTLNVASRTTAHACMAVKALCEDRT